MWSMVQVVPDQNEMKMYLFGDVNESISYNNNKIKIYKNHPFDNDQLMVIGSDLFYSIHKKQ